MVYLVLLLSCHNSIITFIIHFVDITDNIPKATHPIFPYSKNNGFFTMTYPIWCNTSSYVSEILTEAQLPLAKAHSCFLILPSLSSAFFNSILSLCRWLTPSHFHNSSFAYLSSNFTCFISTLSVEIAFHHSSKTHSLSPITLIYPPHIPETVPPSY